MHDRVTLIGFGEAGETFARAGRWQQASAYDPKADRRAAIANFGLRAADSPQLAMEDAKLVLSLVTADQALAAACDCAAHLPQATLWCDMNSVAPQTKRKAEGAIAAAGGRYVDVAILGPVHPSGTSVPLLVSGAHAHAAALALRELGFTNIREVGEQVGRASAIKMIRSVMVKGIEALTDEMMQAAEAADVADEVLASLDASEGHDDWKTRAAYNQERMRTHGLRRAAEMEQSALTLRDLGVEPLMTDHTVRRQRGAASPAADEKATT